MLFVPPRLGNNIWDRTIAVVPYFTYVVKERALLPRRGTEEIPCNHYFREASSVHEQLTALIFSL